MARPTITKKLFEKKKPYSARKFYLDDQPRSLFPLSTNRILIEDGEDKVSAFIDNLLKEDRPFLPQRTVHASKDKNHLRRTVKLDVVSEYFIYQIVYRNRNRFRKPHSDDKKHFGYRFEGGEPIQASRSYREFKSDAWEKGVLNKNQRYLSFDIASYFNNLYHHDLQAWFSALDPIEAKDSQYFGKFLREINAGRSLDCLPQGLYPTKMVGNDFLRFIEENCLIRSSYIYRFMDDICPIDPDESVLSADFDYIQRLLGQKGLSINSAKTASGSVRNIDEADEKITELKKRLLKRRREVIISHYGWEDAEEDVGNSPEARPLNEEEIQFAVNLLSSEQLSEEDAELVLIVMRDHVNRITEHLHLFAEGFPHLAKNFYFLCAEAEDKNAVAQVICNVLRSKSFVSEYQLFWFGMMLDKYLLETSRAGDLISLLYQHPNATDISRAKILEIRDARFGLSEFRERYLREGRSDWHAWSSAVGSMALKKDARNYLLGYFRNGSEMNGLIADIVEASG